MSLVCYHTEAMHLLTATVLPMTLLGCALALRHWWRQAPGGGMMLLAVIRETCNTGERIFNGIANLNANQSSMTVLYTTDGGNRGGMVEVTKGR